MRTDDKLEDSIRKDAAWDSAVSRTVALLDVGEAVTESRINGLKSSFSGHERNRLFVSDHAQTFRDLSSVSGLDSEKDGRVFVKWDFDRDGWIDIGVVNLNRPLLNLYRNELGEQGETGQFIAIRFVGGNRTPKPNDTYSARDGYGAKVTLTAGDLKLIREHQCGEGMAAQNSATMLIGINDHSQVDRVHVRWPSGKTQEISNVDAGTLLTFHENPDDAPEAKGITSARYRTNDGAIDWTENQSSEIDLTTLLGKLRPVDSGDSKLIVFTTMATWCPTCKGELPQWKYLKAELGDHLILNGVPIDEDDDHQKLTDYAEQNHPAYQLLLDVPSDQRQAFQQHLATLLRSEALPSTIVTDGNYQILLATKSVPTLSQIKQAIAEQSLRDGDSSQ